MSSIAPAVPRPVPAPRIRAAPGLFSTAGLARLCAHHPWRTLAAWLAVIALAGWLSRGLADALTTEVTMTNEPESTRADDLLASRLRPFTPVTETVIVRSSMLTADDPAFEQVVQDTTRALAGLDGIVASAVSPYDAQDNGDPSATNLFSVDRHTVLIPVTLVGDFEEADKHGDAYLEAVDAQAKDGFQILTVGAVSSDKTFGTMAEEDLRTGEAIGIPVALIVLVVVFGAIVAAGLPLLLGAVAIVAALGLTAIVGRQLDLFVFVTNVVTMLGLAVGIDYSLFIVARYREERRSGAGKLAAIEIAGGTASKAVLFSGTTVVLALAGMFFVPLTVFQSIGVAAILVVVSAVAATLTLIPAMLALLGDRIDWPRGFRGRRSVIAQPLPDRHGFWDRVTGGVVAHPVVAVVASVALLAGLAIPALDLSRGTANVSTLPPSETKQAYEILAADFSAGRINPVQIVVDGNKDDPTVQTGIAALSARLAQDRDFGQPPVVSWNERGDLGLLEVDLATDAFSDRAYAALGRLRGSLIPAAFVDAKGADVLVTGATAMTADYFAAVDDVTPWVFAFVLGLSFLLLTVVFRSVVVPAKAIVMNLLSVGAAYGLLVLVFQQGYGADLLGLQRAYSIEAWIPIFLFCVLFGLSMDYHVFLLSRIREHYDLTGNNREAVATGLRTTARIITGAALIMVVVFGGFAAGRLVQLQEMGFGLAVAIFLDATVVRSVLVPAAMELLGDRNWYLPRRLRWLPDLRIEGQHAAWP